jgi:hypothetical protein
MAGQLDWSVQINVSGTGAVFQPNLPNAQAGATLQAQVGDIVSWGNNTSLTHQPCPTINNDPTGQPNTAVTGPAKMSDPIAPNNSSTPQYVVDPAALNLPVADGTVIYYCCANHPNERGSITIATF